MFYVRGVLFWLILLVLAVAFGAVRQFVLVPAFGDGPARAGETIILCAVDLALIRMFVAKQAIADTGALLRLGVFWTVLTLLFEFGFGHYVMGAPWDQLLDDYNILAGHLWPFVLLTTLLGPLVARPGLSLRGMTGHCGP